MKKIIAIILIAVMCVFALTGCFGNDDKKKDEIKTGAIKFSDAEDGLYIMTKDGELYQANTVGQNFDKSSTSANAERIVVSHENEKYIPKLYKDDKLVYFSSTTAGVPDSYIVEKFRNGGYTIGVYNLKQASSGYYTFKAENLLEDSDLKDKLSEAIGQDIVALVSIDDEKLTDSQLNKAGCIDNMDEDEEVVLGLMKGTKYSELKTIADTVVYYSVSTHSIGTYKTTKNGYIEIELPEEIQDGYVSINNQGLMQVMSENRPDSKN